MPWALTHWPVAGIGFDHLFSDIEVIYGFIFFVTRFPILHLTCVLTARD